MSQQPQVSERGYLAKYRKTILSSSAVVFLLIVLVIPIIPTKETVTKTRTRSLRYDSEVYGPLGVTPKYVRVTNKDSISGRFSVTMNKWYNPPFGQRELEDTSKQSSSISAGATYDFYLPSDWLIVPPMYSFTYTVAAPTTQESYQTTETVYKSMLELLLSS